jgi:hypothetical protein
MKKLEPERLADDGPDTIRPDYEIGRLAPPSAANCSSPCAVALITSEPVLITTPDFSADIADCVQ